MHRLRVFKALRGSASLCPANAGRPELAHWRFRPRRWPFALPQRQQVEASNKRSCPCVDLARILATIHFLLRRVGRRPRRRVSNLEAAIRNADTFAAEVVGTLRGQKREAA